MTTVIEGNKDLERILEDMLAVMSKKSMKEIDEDLMFFTKACDDQIRTLEKEDNLTSSEAFLVLKNYEHCVRNIFLEYIGQLRAENETLKTLIG